MQVWVDGYNATPKDWADAQATPREALPQLTEGQRLVARQFGRTEDDYARGLLMQQRSQKVLFLKAERLGRLLQQFLASMRPGAEVDEVYFYVFQNKFDVKLSADGTSIPLRIDGSVVDEMFEKGSGDAEQRLKRILEYALPVATP